MDVGTQLVATPEPETAIGDGDRVACPAVSNTVANIVIVGRSALRLNEGIVSGSLTERGRVTICGAMLELALASIGEVAPSTKYAKVCNVIGKSLHGQLPPCLGSSQRPEASSGTPFSSSIRARTTVAERADPDERS
jgi:hypothetical protein